MSKFINQNYKNTVSTLVDNSINIMRNNSYVFNNLKPVPCTFYNIDETGSTLDAGTNFEYTLLGPNSPFRFNKIKDAVLYCNDMKILMSIDLTDEGLTGSPVEFEMVVIPDTFRPLPNSFVIFDQLSNLDKTKKYLFVVDKVETDTIDNGTNFYRIHLTLKSLYADDYEYLEKQVIDNYNMVITNSGTTMKSVIKSNDYELITTLQSVLDRIKRYYIELFYNSSVQTFTFANNMGFFYDSYMIEFLIRNNVFKYTGNDYIFIDHAVKPQVTFSIDYDKTIFRAIETCDKSHINNVQAIGQPIENRNCLFATVPDKYFSVQYEDRALFGIFIPIDSVMIGMIQDNTMLDTSIPESKYNPIVSYFNDGSLPSNIIDILENIDMTPSTYNFYYIPILIFVMEKYMTKLMAKST